MKTPPPSLRRGTDARQDVSAARASSSSFPDLDSLAALRAWYEGLTARAAVHRYLGHVRASGQSSRALLARIRRQLRAFALERQRPDLAAVFAHTAVERTRHAASMVQALDTLRATPVPEPSLTDDVGSWLPTRIAKVLQANGISTLAELTLRVPRRKRWWTVVKGLGVTGARRVEAFFHMHPTLTEQARTLVALPTRSPAVAWERMHVPNALDGSNGRFRAPRSGCLLNAQTDYEAVQSWLELHEAPDTTRAYRKEAERLLLWAIIERQKPLSSLTTDDAIAYRSFLRHPAPHERWIGTPCPRSSPEWRPFANGLASNSISYALSVLRALFRSLIEQRYLYANPFAGVTVRGASKREPFDIDNCLTQAQWRIARSVAKQLEHRLGWDVIAAQRLRFILDFAYATGLRARELVDAKLGDIREDENGELWLYVTGKGRKKAKVALPPLALQALEKHLLERGLPASRPNWPRLAALIDNLTGATPAARNAGITTARLRQITTRFFEAVAQSTDQNQGSAVELLKHATPHWLRHTHATHALQSGVELVSVRDNLRHASISTTSNYLHGDDLRRAHQVRKAFKAL
jgi:site-specific recombinase XerD